MVGSSIQLGWDLRDERELKLFKDMISFLGGESHVSQEKRDVGHPMENDGTYKFSRFREDCVGLIARRARG